VVILPASFIDSINRNKHFEVSRLIITKKVQLNMDID